MAVSRDRLAEGFGAVATPLEGVGFVGRCVMGLVPWDHALGAGDFLHATHGSAWRFTSRTNDATRVFTRPISDHTASVPGRPALLHCASM